MSYYKDHLMRQRKDRERLDRALAELRLQRLTSEQKLAMAQRFFETKEPK